MNKNNLKLNCLLCVIFFVFIAYCSANGASADLSLPPDKTVRLVFIHHSTGENWLNDENGNLGITLMNNNYSVSDTNYGWGPGAIGDRTDLGNWWEWFRGPDSAKILSALYKESKSNSYYTRIENPQSGENSIIVFKSCFPNSNLQGDPNDPIPNIASNPLKGQDAGSEYMTVANAKGIYIDLLEYFKSRPDKLFVVITAPPLIDSENPQNARAFNNWLVNDWLKGYPLKNVAVFDFYSVLTSNGGSSEENDLNSANGNHHRIWNAVVQHIIDSNVDSPDTAHYPSEDDHPSQAGNLKATGEFVPLLNYYYNRWIAEKTVTKTQTVTLKPKKTPTLKKTPTIKPTTKNSGK